LASTTLHLEKKFTKNKAFSFVEMAIVLMIIGIIIAAIMQAGFLINRARLSDAKVEIVASPLRNLKSLELWLETTLIESIDEEQRYDYEAISKWNSIHKKNIKKTISFQDGSNDEEFHYYSTGAGKLPSIKIDSEGENGTLRLNDAYFLNDVKEFTIIVVDFAGSARNTNSELDFFICKNSAEDGALTNVMTLKMSLPLSENSRITTYVASGDLAAVVSYDVYVDGKIKLKDKTTTTGDNLDYCLIGNDGYVGNISEIIILSEKLSDEDLTKVHKYLLRKYDISL
jgi:prepilin-type N-terminal cleavage/methylation domain-containing protein